MKRAGIVKRGLRGAVRILCATLACAFMACGCSSRKNEGAELTLQQPEQTADSAPAVTRTPELASIDPATIEPLTITREVVPYDDNYILYPYVTDACGAKINKTVIDGIETAIAQRKDAAYTYYSVKFNSCGILSVLVYITDFETDEIVDLLPMNFDALTGELLSINDCLSDVNDRWKRVIPDILTAQAESMGITLLSDLLPIGNEQRFYFSDKSIVFVYRIYEIATYEAGMPEFTIPLSQLREFVDEDCITARLYMLMES